MGFLRPFLRAPHHLTIRQRTELISTLIPIKRHAISDRVRTINGSLILGWALFLAVLAIACTDKSVPVFDSGYTPEERHIVTIVDAKVLEAQQTVDSKVNTTASDAATSVDNAMIPESELKPDAVARQPEISSDASGSIVEARRIPVVTKPEVIGTLVGPDATYANAGLRVYGTDMGSTFVHKGRHLVLFGDTWPDERFICENFSPSNDDTIATIPLDYPGELPSLDFFTQANTPTEASLIHLYRGNDSLSLGFGLIPIIGFSDGVHAFAFFTRLENVLCNPTPGSTPQLCPVQDRFFCSTDIGICEPGPPLFCNTRLNQGCIVGQQCVGSSLCVDGTSSQYVDGDTWSQTASIAQSIDIAVQDESHPEVFNSVFSWPTNKFSVLTARAIASFTGRVDGNDYRPGHGSLLIWGRPGFITENGRSASLYFATHALPFALQEGSIDFRPQYFAGLDQQTDEPIWSSLQSDAKPLALDGAIGGDPYEAVPMVGHMTISWLGPPIEKWVLLYGGDLVDYLLSDPDSNRYASSPGSIIIRFADFPWGPWSEPVPHLVPGSASQVGDPYGPGGILYHPDCSDDASHICARPNPYRPLDTAVLLCLISIPDPGRLYAPSIIDPYTMPNSQGGLDMYWNVSTWNPYTVQLMKTSFFP
jgi:hypothetical protein